MCRPEPSSNIVLSNQIDCPRYRPSEIGEDQSASFVLQIQSSLRHVGTPIVVETVVHKRQHSSAFNWYGPYGTISGGRYGCSAVV